jgi:hypothetical protein
MSSLRKHVGLYVLFAILLSLFVGLLAFQPVHAAPAVSGPVSLKWNLAEGRVGSGFRTFFTVGNPTNSACAVKVTYYYTLDGSSSGNVKTVSFTVPAATRYTANANGAVPGPSTLSAIIEVDAGATPTCSGVVAERPMYFNSFHNTNSGTEVMGATDASLSQKFYFADVPDGTAGESFLAVFNPQSTAANVTATYYNADTGAEVKHSTLIVGPKSRNTFQPGNENLPAHVSAVVSSDQSILVERPSYFPAQHNVAGSAALMGVSTPLKDWYFADGYTGSGTQEYLIVTNASDNTVTVDGSLIPASGTNPTLAAFDLAPHAQKIIDVNANNTTGSTHIAAHIHGSGNIVVERQVYTTYSGSTGWQAQGVTATVGALGDKSNYTFGEGFTSVGFNESLVLLNTSESQETVNVTLSNMLGRSITRTYTLDKLYTVNITDLVKSDLVQPGDDARGYAVSMAVSTEGNAPFVAERSMYWSAFNTQGANSIVGYAG